MALAINDCLFEKGLGINQVYAGCCCNIVCTITNIDDNVDIYNIQYGFNFEQFTISNFLVNGSSPSYPFTIIKQGTIEISFDICAAVDVDVYDSLFIRFSDNIGVVTYFEFDFLSINLSTSIDINALNFVNVPIGSSSTIPIIIYNPTICCYSYTLSTSCGSEVTFDFDTTETLCYNQSQTINVTYTPLVEKEVNCQATLSNECQTEKIAIYLKGINPPVGGGTRVEQKNKVDQTTRVEACSPRTVNNRCTTARTMQSAIRSNARRFGKK